MNDQRVLVVDDEPAMRDMLRRVLTKAGYRVTEASGGKEALALLHEHPFDALLCDIRMPGMDGQEFLREGAKQGLPTTIMMSAYGTIDTAVECMKLGAYDFISKPFRPDEVLMALRKAGERQQLHDENRRLRSQLASNGKVGEMVYTSEEMQRLAGLIERVADSVSPVLVTGETGTGKELVARALHQHSSRHSGPFVAVNCGAISSGLMESELFGHIKGAFTGADRERKGLFAAASQGTLFLDEIGELPLELQPKLLRVLQEGEVRPVGASKTRAVDVRVVTATARDLQQEVEQGRFRDDLYYRLNVLHLHLPPLRERSEDIPLLAQHFTALAAGREGLPAPEIDEDALATLSDYGWPGNVRELQNFMEKALIFCRDKRLGVNDLPWEVRREPREASDNLSLKKAAVRLEKEYIRKALAATGGNRTRAAKLLEISHRALLYKMKDYAID
ncbi:MAG: hypothetical protein C0624_00460 [Desulfuromonas sp.]|nr:MAG: hypothetical protein C0624_00460 [Desulfuromonas sp.]